MKIELRNGESYTLEPTSTDNHWIVFVDKFAMIDEIKLAFNEANLAGAFLIKDDVKEKLEFIVPTELKAIDAGNDVCVHMITRKKTAEELHTEQIDELQSAVADLMLGGI